MPGKLVLGLVFPLAPPAQEQPCAVAIRLEDVLLLTVPKERNVWGAWWQHIYDLKLYCGPEGQLPKLINKWTKIKFRKENSSTDERSCQPGFIHFGLGDSRRRRIQWHSNLSLQVKGHKMGSNLFFMGHHFLAFFFFFFWQETTGNLYQCCQRHTLVTLTNVTLYLAKRVTAGNPWDAQLTSTGQNFQAAAMLAGLPAMLSGHTSAKGFWEHVGSDATDQ